MSIDLVDRDPVRVFYGDPQHETDPCLDPERVGVIAPPPQCDRVLYEYAGKGDSNQTRVDTDAFSTDAQAV